MIAASGTNPMYDWRAELPRSVRWGELLIAHRFHERLGSRRIDRRRFEGDDCYVYRLARADWRAHGKG